MPEHIQTCPLSYMWTAERMMSSKLSTCTRKEKKLFGKGLVIVLVLSSDWLILQKAGGRIKTKIQIYANLCKCLQLLVSLDWHQCKHTAN